MQLLEGPDEGHSTKMEGFKPSAFWLLGGYSTAVLHPRPSDPSKQKSEHFKVDHYWALRIRDLLRMPSPPLGMSHRDRTVYKEIFGMSYVSCQRDNVHVMPCFKTFLLTAQCPSAVGDTKPTF